MAERNDSAIAVHMAVEGSEREAMERAFPEVREATDKIDPRPQGE